jgi:hypothetical protein
MARFPGTASTSELNLKKGPHLGPLPYAITERGLLRGFKNPKEVPFTQLPAPNPNRYMGSQG